MPDLAASSSDRPIDPVLHTCTRPGFLLRHTHPMPHSCTRLGLLFRQTDPPQHLIPAPGPACASNPAPHIWYQARFPQTQIQCFIPVPGLVSSETDPVLPYLVPGPPSSEPKDQHLVPCHVQSPHTPIDPVLHTCAKASSNTDRPSTFIPVCGCASGTLTELVPHTCAKPYLLRHTQI